MAGIFQFIKAWQSGADGRLFGSISLKLIASALSELSEYKLNYSNIILDEPIKVNGVFKVQVMLHPEIFASVLVVVAKSESEAQDALSEYKEGGKKKSDDEKEQELDLIEKNQLKNKPYKSIELLVNLVQHSYLIVYWPDSGSVI